MAARSSDGKLQELLGTLKTDGVEALDQLMDAYEERRAERASRQKAILRYVTPPTAEQLGQIREFLRKKYENEELPLELVEDKSLLGGFCITVGSEEYDWSMKGRLTQMRNRLTQTPQMLSDSSEVIDLLRTLARGLLQENHLRFLDKGLHLVAVEDGESRELIGRSTTFFDIGSTKDRQFGFSMDLGGGKKLTCCGDEPYHDCEESYVRGSTWLLHEAFCLHSQADVFHPYEKHHSTVADACRLARELEVENLVLYHTEDKNLPRRKELYTREGREYFAGGLYIPDDLERIQL